MVSPGHSAPSNALTFTDLLITVLSVRAMGEKELFCKKLHSEQLWYSSLVHNSLLYVQDYFSLSSMVRAIIISSLVHNN